MTSRWSLIFDFADGLHAYLYRKVTFAISGMPGDWVVQSGLTLKVQGDDLVRRPFLVLEGEANYNALRGEPKVRAVLTNPASAELPASLKANGTKYLIVIDCRTICASAQEYSIQLTFDRYFVPKDLGINNDTRQLVIMVPTKTEMRSSPPLE